MHNINLHCHLVAVTHLKRVFEPVDGGGVERAHDLEYAVEVVELLEDDHDLKDARHDEYSLLKVTGLHDTLLQPERKLKPELRVW